MIVNGRHYDIKKTIYYNNKCYCVENIATSPKGLKAFCYIVEYNDDDIMKRSYWEWIYKKDNLDLWDRLDPHALY